MSAVLYKKYQYKIIDKFNNKFENNIEAKNREEATQILTSKGFKVLKLTEIKVSWITKANAKLGANKLSAAHRLEFFTDLYSLLKLGININNALDHITKNEVTDQKIRNVSHLLHHDIEKGINFGDALIENGFGKDVGEIIRSGISVGETKETIRLIVEREKLQQKVSKGFKSVFAMPMIMVPTIIAGTFAALIYLVPLLKQVITSMVSHPSEIPSTSALVFYIADNVGLIALMMFGTIGTFIFAFIFLHKISKTFRIKVSKILLSIPVVGNFIYYKEMANITSLMALSLGSGYRNEDVIKASLHQITNAYTKEKFNRIYKLVKDSGYSISEAMRLVSFEQVIYTTLQRGELAGRKETVKSLQESTDYFVEKTLHNLKVMENSTEFINIILMYVVSIPLLFVTIIPQFDQLKIMIGKM